MTILKILLLLFVFPLVLLGLAWGLVWHSFCAGMMKAENVLQKLIYP